MLSRDEFTTVSVPSDGSCLYWATCLAYLFPVRHNIHQFTARFSQAFGRDTSERSRISRLRELLIGWNLRGQKVPFSRVIDFMQPLVNGQFRLRVIQEMSDRKDKYLHFISLSSFCESQNEGFFTRGLFQKHFQREFASEIETCGVDISKLKPKSLGVIQRADIDAELDKMVSQQDLALFKYEMYLKCMALSTSWGGQPEIQAASQVLKCNIHVFQDVLELPGISFLSGVHWVYLIHSNGNHYNFGLVKATNMLDAMKREIDADEVERCLAVGVDDVDVSNRFGWTMLHFVAKAGNEKVVKLLIEHGANVNAENTQRKTPAYLAQKYRNFGVLQLLEKELKNLTDNGGDTDITQLKMATKNSLLKQETLHEQEKSTTIQTLVKHSIPKKTPSKEQRTSGHKTTPKATESPHDQQLRLQQASQEMMVRGYPSRAIQTEGEKAVHVTSSRATRTEGEKAVHETSSRATQTDGELAVHVTSLRQVKILQQQLLEVIRERNALEQVILASKKLTRDNRQEQTDEVGSVNGAASGPLMKEILILKEENSSLKRKVKLLELELTSTQNVVSGHSTVTLNENEATGGKVEIFQKHADLDKRCRNMRPSKASTMRVAGQYGSVVFRYSPHHWRSTSLSPSPLAHEELLIRASLINTKPLFIDCHSFSLTRENYISGEHLKRCGKFESFDFIFCSNGREMVTRKDRMFLFSMYPRNSTDEASSSVNGVGGNVFLGFKQFQVRLDGVIDEQDAIRALDRIGVNLTKRNRQIVTKCVDLISTPTRSQIVITLDGNKVLVSDSVCSELFSGHRIHGDKTINCVWLQ